MKPNVEGVLPILHTPFTERDEIDRAALRREIDWAFSVGADGVCSAMVSEILRLTHEERLDLTTLMVEAAGGRGAVVASVGAESTKAALQYARAAASAGCTAIMAIPPVSTALPENALWSYFTALADEVDLPLIVQDASSYVGRAIPVSFYVRLLERYSPEKILFKPEASPNGPNISALRDASSERARIFDGSGGMLLVDAHRRGLAGTMPGCDLLDALVLLWRALGNRDQVRVDRLAYPVSAIVALQLQAGLDGFLAIEKHLMARRGLFPSDRRRAPFAWTLDPETRAHVDQLFAKLLEIVGECSA